MKKQSHKGKKKKTPKKDTASTAKEAVGSNVRAPHERSVKQKLVRSNTKKAAEKKGSGDRSVSKNISRAVQFLREARTELKKVKWPTKKELFASTAVVIVLTLVVAFFLGLVDFGLIKIIKVIVG